MRGGTKRIWAIADTSNEDTWMTTRAKRGRGHGSLGNALKNLGAEDWASQPSRSFDVADVGTMKPSPTLLQSLAARNVVRTCIRARTARALIPQLPMNAESRFRSGLQRNPNATTAIIFRPRRSRSSNPRASRQRMLAQSSIRCSTSDIESIRHAGTGERPSAVMNNPG